jgi:hypothetical protein
MIHPYIKESEWFLDVLIITTTLTTMGEWSDTLEGKKSSFQQWEVQTPLLIHKHSI